MGRARLEKPKIIFTPDSVLEKNSTGKEPTGRTRMRCSEEYDVEELEGRTDWQERPTDRQSIHDG